MKCRYDSVYLKLQSTGVYEERVEHKNLLQVLSKFSTKEVIQALKCKEDMQITDTNKDTYKVSMNLMEVKKHVLVINNCNPQLVEHRRFAGGY
ncbi:TPA: hypothetical protein QCX53_005315 [Bacillus cereus]|nr:hypothetical protein [Bacillus cereus]